MNVELISPLNVDQIWPIVSSGFLNCLKKAPTTMSLGEFWANCRSGHGFLFVCHDESGVSAASIWRFEGEYFVCLLMYGENASSWVPEHFECALKVARSNGCKALMASGRVGLGRMLNKNGVPAKVYRQTYILEV